MVGVSLVAALGVVYSGIIDVGAAQPHYAFTKRVLETTMEHSVERRAEKISPPLEYRATPRTMQHFGEMCELCHGGPGKEPSAIGKGLRPDPPDLAKVADRLTPPGNILDHEKRHPDDRDAGICGTHQDKELWETVSFVKSLPRLSPGEYRSAVGSGAGHSH